jgi:hypothetical protein
VGRLSGPRFPRLFADYKEPAVADDGACDDDWVGDAGSGHGVDGVAPCHVEGSAIFEGSVHDAVALGRDLTSHDVGTRILAGARHVQDDGFAGEAFHRRNFMDALRRRYVDVVIIFPDPGASIAGLAGLAEFARWWRTSWR